MKRKYQIIDNYKTAPGVWTVTYFVWLGCPGNKKRKSVTILKERRPSMLDVMEVDKVIPI